MGFIIMTFYIKIGSITNAQRAGSALHAASIKAGIKRLEKPKPGEGCGYMLVVNSDVSKALRILEKNGIRVLGVDKE